MLSYLDEKETAYWAWLKVYSLNLRFNAHTQNDQQLYQGNAKLLFLFHFFKPEKNNMKLWRISSCTNLQMSTGIYSTLDDKKRKEKNVNGVRK